MSAFRIGRLPPAGEYIGPDVLRRVLSDPDPQSTLTRGLQTILGLGATLTFHASGREAMRVALAHLAKESGRSEVIVPAYTCFSVAASAVAAGLRVRLVDVDLDGRIDLNSLMRLPLERAAAVVVCNLFGNPEPIEPVRKLAAAAGAAVVDDAAQSLGARSSEGAVGARGDVGVLSFARGKPLSALGGGAIMWRGEPTPEAGKVHVARGRAIVKALAFDIALTAPVFRILASVPFLGIGDTVYDQDFHRGHITGASLALAAASIHTVVQRAVRRAEIAIGVAERVRGQTRFAPILAEPSAFAVFPRVALLAPNATDRERALSDPAMRKIGASGMYPSPLDEIVRLRSDLVANTTTSGAREFSSRLLTLPSSPRLRGADLSDALSVLATGAACAG